MSVLRVARWSYRGWVVGVVVEVLVGAVLVRELHRSRQLHRSGLCRLVGVVLVSVMVNVRDSDADSCRDAG